MIYPNTPSKTSYDVAIIGGAMIGSSVAWFLSKNPDFNGSILVIEQDPTYETCSTAHTNSCLRQQFSTALNIKISQFGAEFIANFPAHMNNDPRVPEVFFDSFGYLYLANTPEFCESLQAMQTFQKANGAGTQHLTKDEIHTRYPFFQLDDIVGANLNRVNEGYFDGGTLFDWWKKSAREQGADYIHNRLVGFEKNAKGDKIQTILLADGQKIAVGTVVNATGPRAALSAAMAGIELPVEPRKRYTFIFKAETPLDRPLPLTIDPTGVHIRQDGANYLAGCPPDDDPPVAPDDFIFDHSIWEAKLWPAIAARIPQFEAIKVINAWVGHYAFNHFDQNAIVGPHTQISNFIFANGFSGHGLQQSPAIGRGISEWITYGRYKTIDLHPLHFERIAANTPYIERAVI